GSSLWLTAGWADLSQWNRVFIGWLPVVITNVLWAVFWRCGSYRAAHLMLLLGSFSLPLAMGVLLGSTTWLQKTIGDPSFEIGPLAAVTGKDPLYISNLQEVVALGVGMVWIGLCACRVRTVATSALCAAFAVLVYCVILDMGDLEKLVTHRQATLALRFLPMPLIAAGVGTF